MSLKGTHGVTIRVVFCHSQGRVLSLGGVQFITQEGGGGLCQAEGLRFSKRWAYFVSQWGVFCHCEGHILSLRGACFVTHKGALSCRHSEDAADLQSFSDWLFQAFWRTRDDRLFSSLRKLSDLYLTPSVSVEGRGGDDLLSRPHSG